MNRVRLRPDAALEDAMMNRQVDGQATKLNEVNRQMYGKAGFALLRQRLLHAL
jgi:transposase